MALYLWTVVVTLMFFIYDNWNDGYDLRTGDLFGMIIVALIPVLNVILAVFFGIMSLVRKFIPKGQPILRGKQQ